VGSFARTALEVLDHDLWKIHCFEPNKKGYGAIVSSLEPHLGKRVFAFNVGIGDTVGTCPLFGNGPGSVLGSLYQRRLDHFGITMEKVEDVPITTLEQVCQENGINRIHYLKLDVEGHEVKALQGARSLLDDGRIDFVQFEFGGCNIDSKTYFQDFWYVLEKYRIHRIVKDGLFEIGKYTEKDEIFETQNFLAERRE
ncbi:MAG: FkbM family methyltransferase, partial [Alphaproteobacteria bacterium]